MINERVLQQVVERIVAAAKPSRVIFFGSYGRDSTDEDSDLDTMVVKSEVREDTVEWKSKGGDTRGKHQRRCTGSNHKAS